MEFTQSRTESQKTMKKRNDEQFDPADEPRDHYDYSKAKPNRFADKMGEDTIVVVLDSDVASAFPTPESVNEALRLVIRLSSIPEIKA